MGAMPAYKRTEITVETDHVMTIRRRRTIRVWCRQCGCVVDAVGVEEAGTITGNTPSKLKDSNRSRGWHICEGWDGEMLICLESVLGTK